jgi:hypothetical protein
MPPSVGSPRFARGTAWGAWVPPASRGEPRKGSVPPACRGNLKEGVIGHTRFCELWLRDWYDFPLPLEDAGNSSEQIPTRIAPEIQES